MFLFNFNYFFKGPDSKYAYNLQELWELEPQHMSLGGHSLAHNRVLLQLAFEIYCSNKKVFFFVPGLFAFSVFLVSEV